MSATVGGRLKMPRRFPSHLHAIGFRFRAFMSECLKADKKS